MRRNYKFTSVEEKANLRKSIFFVVLTLALLAALYFLGLPLIIKVASFMGEVGKSKTTQKADSVPPGPPSFDLLPKATKDARITVKGRSEPDTIVAINLNDSVQEITSNEFGEFSLSLDLEKGENIIWATAKDSSGNVSHPSDKIKISFDSTIPTLDVQSPADGAEFQGSAQRQVTIQGKTEPGIQITINGRYVSVLEDGSFSYSTSLSSGENKFEVKASDDAQNQAEKTLTVSFIP